MKLHKVKFIKFRSLSENLLDIENDITCLVGVNESGKSNTLIALEQADSSNTLSSEDYSRHAKDFGEDDNYPEIKMWLGPVDKNEEKELKQIFGHEKINTIVMTKKYDTYQLDYPSLNFDKIFESVSEDTKTIEESDSVEEHEDSTPESEKQNILIQSVNRLISLIPKFIRFDSVDFDEYFLPENGEVNIPAFLENPDGMKPIKNLLELGGITEFSRLVANDEKTRIRREKILGDASKKINSEILRVVWPIESVEVELSGESDILKIRLKEKGETSPFIPGERSRGLQWALAFNIFFLAETKNELQKCVLLIDEPGIFLHINAQNKLLEETFIRIIDEGNQVIYTTHLPFLIDSQFPERIRILEKDNEDTKIGNKAWLSGDFGKIPEPVRTALGIKWSDLYKVAENTVIVEGPSDQILFREIYKIFGDTKELIFIPAYGYNNIPPALVFMKIENKKGLGIVDGDINLNDLIKTCEKISISRDKVQSISTLLNNKQIISIEDLIPEEIIREAIYQAYLPTCERRKNCSLEKSDLPLKFPRVKNLEDFFKKKFRSNEHKLLKMQITREVVKILSKNFDINVSEWKNAREIISKIENHFITLENDLANKINIPINSES